MIDWDTYEDSFLNSKVMTRNVIPNKMSHVCPFVKASHTTCFLCVYDKVFVTPIFLPYDFEVANRHVYFI